jgi:hypothetical protein
MKVEKRDRINALIVKFEKDGDGYTIFTGRMVRYITNAEEYGDGVENPNRMIIRNPGVYSPYNDLGIRAQGKNGDSPRYFYGEKVAYYGPYEVDCERVRKMLPVLRSYEKKMGKIYDTDGPYTSLSVWVNRVCKVLGLKYIIFSKDSRGWSYDDCEHEILSVDNGVSKISIIETDWKGSGILSLQSKVA